MGRYIVMDLIFDILKIVGIIVLDMVLVVIYAFITYLTEWKICDIVDSIRK